jgi:hypothetical protein|tara:strand:- start:1025 stop:1528 length:504 start_codon:yes stop_codon:yes gene_type:complete
MENINSNKNQGRINLKNENGTPMYFQDMIKNNDRSNYSNVLKHTLNESNLSIRFFSKENIDIIQSKIKETVNQKTNNKYIIKEQQIDQLKMVMKSIFLQYSLNIEYDIPKQINVLNELVIKYCVPNVYSELMSYVKYLKDISTLPVPIDFPEYNVCNDKTLELKPFF